MDRGQDIERIAAELLPKASLLTRLLLVRGGGVPSLTRGESGLLAALEDGPRRVTELAADLAFAQPTVTQLVARLEARALLVRGQDPQDRRVVRVTITQDGRDALRDLRVAYQAVLRSTLADRDDAQLRALAEAVAVLDDLIRALRDEGGPA